MSDEKHANDLVTLTLSRKAIYLLLVLLNDRIAKADRDGISRDHPSSHFRDDLWRTLHQAHWEGRGH